MLLPLCPAVLRCHEQVWGRCWGFRGAEIFIYQPSVGAAAGLPVACRGQGKDGRVACVTARRKNVGGWPWILGHSALLASLELRG